MGYNYVSITKKGSNKRSNEDSIGILELEDGILCIVCDGLGGGLAAGKASEICVKTIQTYFLESNKKNHLSRIRESIISANAELFGMSISSKKLKGMATTTDVFFFNNSTIIWGHIGDSRIYHLKNGKLYQLTKDHSLVQQMLDKGYISMKAASKHPNKNVIMSALGESLDVEIDSSKLILDTKADHRFMICSDGVNAVLGKKELEIILKENDLDKCINLLDKKIKSAGAPDDYSIIIIERIQ
ncbi:MAG: serine/threonine-protein phosphatase [Ignavibacteria bacterium]|jgi:protein phosphatase|nr:MAG: serine/threonine-protein phosphatase [Ignavibacteria bacterium]